MEEKVKTDVYAMHLDKSPGPDGMNLAFFQNFWSIVGADVVSACLHILNTCTMPPELNDMIIVLIPKKKTPKKITDMCSISICNVLYKIVAKTLANRLKRVVGDMVGVSQSAFIEGWMITDNVLVASEVNHFLKGKRQGKTGVAALKIDMSKAYDRIEWGFIHNIMAKMGFATQFIDLTCCMSLRYIFCGW